MTLYVIRAALMPILCVWFGAAHGAAVVSIRSGYWDEPSTWDSGSVPDGSSDIVIHHEVVLRSPSRVTVRQMLVAGHLILGSGASLGLSADPGVTLQITGILECADGSELTGTTATNTLFASGARYIHRQGPLGFIPIATWDIQSTLQISGFIDDGYINLAHATSWRQSFGNVEYDCPQQTVFVVDLNGNLRDIRGNFVIKNTNNKALRLCTTQQVTINVGGTLQIEGTSQMWFSTNSASCNVNIGGNFIYRTQSASGSYLATRGNVRLTVAGNLLIDAQSVLRMASSAADSTGSRQSWISVRGDFQLLRGGLVAPPPGTGRATIEFSGSGLQRVSIGPIANPLVGNLEFNIGSEARVNLGESALISDNGALMVDGTLELGSTDPLGAIQAGRSGGNIRIPGPRTFTNGSTVVYNGTSAQFMGSAHPSSASTILDNDEGITQLTDVTIQGDLLINRGAWSQAGHSLSVGENVTTARADNGLKNLRLSGSGNQIVDINGTSLAELTVAKTGGRVDLISPLSITVGVYVTSSGTVVASNGNLTLLSTADAPGQTACIGPLPAGSAITGDVIVQRFMSAEGRLYRYLSSPTSNATVASLMDDFPVSGTFADPSVGPGIKSSNPSFFDYDETRGTMLSGWRGYPTSGLAADAPLRPGYGYAAFIRNTNPTTVDFAGPVNQGDITLPLSHTVHAGQPNGWHLAGNPYPASIDWDAPALGKQMLSQVIVIRDNADRRFRYWDGDPQFSTIPDGRIALGQSFWVRALSPGASLSFREAAKTEDAAFFRRPLISVPSLCITVSDGAASDHVIIRLRKQSIDSLDTWDGVKLSNDFLNLSSAIISGENLAIDSRQKLPDSIALILTDAAEGQYKLTLSADEYFRHLTFYIRDRFLKQTVIVNQNASLEFTITEDDQSSRPDRFVVYLFDSAGHAATSATFGDSAAFNSKLLFTRYGNRVSSAELVHPIDSRSAQSCLQVYPNPAVDELVIDRCCDSQSAETWMAIHTDRHAITDARAFEPVIFNAAGMRIDREMITVESIRLSSDRSNYRGECMRQIIHVGRLAAGTYELCLFHHGIAKCVTFVKK